MRLIQIVDMLNSLFEDVAFYPLQFPYNTEGTSNEAVVDVVNGDSRGKSKTDDLQEINIQIMTRSKHPSTAEELANTFITELHNKTNITSDGNRVILIQAQNSNPFYNGQDEDNFYIYTTDFRLLVE